MKFPVNWTFGSPAEVQNRFSRWRSWQPTPISDRNHFSFFLPTSHPNTSYQISSQLHFGSGEEVQNRFSRWLPWSPSWISNLYYVSFFQSNSHLRTSYEGFKSIGLSVKDKNCKIHFQDSVPGSHLGFPIGTIKIFFIYKLPVPRYFQPSFDSVGHSVQRRV